MKITVSIEGRSVRVCLALGLLLTFDAILSGYIYPGLPAAILFQGDCWSIATALSAVLIALVAFARPLWLFRRWFIGLSFLLPLVGLSTVELACAGNPGLIWMAMTLCGLGDGWFAVITCSALAQIGVRRCAVAIPIALVFAALCNTFFARLPLTLATAAPFDMFCNIGAFLLVRPYALDMFSAVQAQKTSNRSGALHDYVREVRPVVIPIVLFNGAYGFVGSIQAAGVYQGALWQVIPPLACLAYTFLGKRRDYPLDGLFRCAAFLLVGGVLFLPLFPVGSERASIDLFGILFFAAHTCFALLQFYIIAAVGERSKARAFGFAAVVLGIAWIAWPIGASISALLKTVFARPDLILWVANAVALLLVLYAFVILRTFSFEATIMRVKQPPITPKARPIGDENFVERCHTLALHYGLTKREGEIFGLLARGRSVPVIQDKLTLSPNTVKTHIRHIYEKVGVHSQQAIIDMVEHPPTEFSGQNAAVPPGRE